MDIAGRKSAFFVMARSAKEIRRALGRLDNVG